MKLYVYFLKNTLEKETFKLLIAGSDVFGEINQKVIGYAKIKDDNLGFLRKTTIIKLFIF